MTPQGERPDSAQIQALIGAGSLAGRWFWRPRLCTKGAINSTAWASVRPIGSGNRDNHSKMRRVSNAA